MVADKPVIDVLRRYVLATGLAAVGASSPVTHSAAYVGAAVSSRGIV
jgi:hypothetical protein